MPHLLVANLKFLLIWGSKEMCNPVGMGTLVDMRHQLCRHVDSGYTPDIERSMCIIVVMHIDIVPNRNSNPTILLRESYREGGKVRK